jgi:hypothetical protein
MNEQEQANHFSAWLDHSMPPEARDDESLLTLARTLAQVDFSAESRIRESLRDQLLSRANRNSSRDRGKRSPNPRRTLAAIVAALLLITAAILAFPPLRALAQEVLRQIGLIQLTNAPSSAQLWLTHTPIPALITPLPNLELEEARATFGRAIYTPTYVPAGYVLTRLSASHGSVSSLYNLVVDGECCRTLWITQLRNGGSTSPFGVGDAPIVDVTVGDLPGEWVENAPIGADPSSESGILPANLLTWRDSDNVFWIQSFSTIDDQRLPLDEMLRIAESLRAE